MKSKAMLFICRLLVISVMSLSFQAAHAGMIGVDQVIASSASAQAERDAVLRVLSRTEVSGQLQTMGLDARTASDRVAAMTDDEVRSLAGKLESLPAGANGGDWGWGLLAVIVIAAAIYYMWGWKK